MSKDIKRFKTYGQQNRRDFARREAWRKREVRATRIEILRTKTAIESVRS